MLRSNMIPKANSLLSIQLASLPLGQPRRYFSERFALASAPPLPSRKPSVDLVLDTFRACTSGAKCPANLGRAVWTAAAARPSWTRPLSPGPPTWCADTRSRYDCGSSSNSNSLDVFSFRRSIAKLGRSRLRINEALDAGLRLPCLAGQPGAIRTLVGMPGRY